MACGPEMGTISPRSTPRMHKQPRIRQPLTPHPTVPVPGASAGMGRTLGYTSTSTISTCSPSQSSIHGKRLQATGKDFLFILLDDFQAWRVMLSTPSHGTALVSHFGCCVLLHLHTVDDILWEVSDNESTKGVRKHTSVHG